MAPVLEMAVLGLLKEQDMHGYELRKRLSDVFGVAMAVSFGSLYPALARLEGTGAVQVTPGTPGPAPSERRGSRRRKVYGITPKGAEMFAELLAGSQTSGDDERNFHLRLAFASYLPPDARLGLLERRRVVLGERLAQLAARARAKRDDRYLRVLFQRQHDELSSDMSWLERLIQEERAGRPGAAAGGWSATGPAGPDEAGAAPGPAVAGPRRLVPLASASQLQRAAPGRAGRALQAGP